ELFSSSWAFFMFDFDWISLPFALPYGVLHVNMEGHGRDSSLTPTCARRKGSCGIAASAAWRTFGLLNGGCRWLKRHMYWKPSGSLLTSTTPFALFRCSSLSDRV